MLLESTQESATDLRLAVNVEHSKDGAVNSVRSATGLLLDRDREGAIVPCPPTGARLAIVAIILRRMPAPAEVVAAKTHFRQFHRLAVDSFVSVYSTDSRSSFPVK
jgi:hypothetical protein